MQSSLLSRSIAWFMGTVTGPPVIGTMVFYSSILVVLQTDAVWVIIVSVFWRLAMISREQSSESINGVVKMYGLITQTKAKRYLSN